MSTIKTRIKTRHFLEDMKVTASYTIEVLMNRKWLPLGDDNGTRKFATKEEALAECASLKTMEIET